MENTCAMIGGGLFALFFMIGFVVGDLWLLGCVPGLILCIIGGVFKDW